MCKVVRRCFRDECEEMWYEEQDGGTTDDNVRYQLTAHRNGSTDTVHACSAYCALKIVDTLDWRA